MAKKGKKGKKGKNAGPEPITTLTVLNERAKMLCPRLGDVYTRSEYVDGILEEVCGKVIEKAILKKSSSLPLTSLKLDHLPDFQKLSAFTQSIVEVDLSKNHLFNGDALFQQLSHLTHLRKLNLSYNYLNGDMSQYIGQLLSLEDINLNVNQLTNISPEVGNLIHLKSFSIADNNITAIPDACVAWTQIERLDFRNNKISEIPGCLLSSWKDKLEKIFMGYNLLKVIPEEIGECIHLIEVEFSNNAIEALPLSIANCHDLQHLHLGSNKITEIPSEIIAGLSHLKELQLYKNKITVVPPEIGMLNDLERMSFASNNIKRVPEEIGSCTQLKELYLGNNKKLAIIPSTAGHLRSLKELSLRKCPALKQLPPTIAELGDLKELDIRAPKKQVCKITPDMVDALKKNRCIVRGGVVKKAKSSKRSKKASS
jgi:Leucine-rich repeat (LRR) protein